MNRALYRIWEDPNVYESLYRYSAGRWDTWRWPCHSPRSVWIWIAEGHESAEATDAQQNLQKGTLVAKSISNTKTATQWNILNQNSRKKNVWNRSIEIISHICAKASRLRRKYDPCSTWKGISNTISKKNLDRNIPIGESKIEETSKDRH